MEAARSQRESRALSRLLAEGLVCDWTEGGKFCHTKALLKIAAYLLSVPPQPHPDFEVYKMYMEAFRLYSVGGNLSALKRFPENKSFFKTLYKLDKPLENPDNFSFSSFSSVNRLGELLSTDLVVLLCSKHQNWIEIMHDFRFPLPGGRHTRPVKWIVLSKNDKGLYLLPDHLGARVEGLLTVSRPTFLIPSRDFEVALFDAPERRAQSPQATLLSDQLNLSLHVAGVYLDHGASLTEPFDESAAKRDSLGIEAFMRGPERPYITVERLLSGDKADLESIWEALGRRIYVVVKFSRYLKVRLSCMHPTDSYFTTLATIGPRPENLPPCDPSKTCPRCFFNSKGVSGKACPPSEHTVSLHADAILCVYGNRSVRILRPGSCRSLFLRYCRFAHTDLLRGGLQISEFPSQEEAMVAQMDSMCRKEAGKPEWKLRREQYLSEKKCRCQLCAQSLETYFDNMSHHGPETLCTVSLSIRDLLKATGLSEPHFEGIVSKMCEATLAAFDIESRTVDSSVHQTGEDLPERGELSCGSVGQYQKKFQKPCMLAHADYLTPFWPLGGSLSESLLERDLEVVRKTPEDFSEDRFVNPRSKTQTRLDVFRVEGDDEHHVFKMFESYWDYLELRRLALEGVKLKIAGPILEALEPYKRAYVDFCDKWVRVTARDLIAVALADNSFDELTRDRARRYLRGSGELGPELERFISETAKRAKDSYRGTIHGMLEAKLRALAKRLDVLAFYGSGYDHVLLFAYLTPYLHEKKLKPKLEKRGNKVTSIVTSCGVNFRDVCKLLAPSTNLRNFGRLFGMEQEKAHFPFSYLTSMEVLKERRLPSDPEAWKSDLTSSPPVTEADIEEAQRLFESARCRNLGDYLETYLKLDVVILYTASQKWRASLSELVGVDFVETRSFTISSLANRALGVSMAERLHIGLFFPNNVQNYGLLRQGMRGGLCQVFRNSAGGQHREDGDELPGKLEFLNHGHVPHLRAFCCQPAYSLARELRRKLLDCKCRPKDERAALLREALKELRRDCREGETTESRLESLRRSFIKPCRCSDIPSFFEDFVTLQPEAGGAGPELGPDHPDEEFVLPGESAFVHYYDAGSLYPSSGEKKNLPLVLLERGGGEKKPPP